jgi:hypothetical protein
MARLQHTRRTKRSSEIIVWGFVPWERVLEVRKTGIYSLVRFVRTLKQDLSAVEATVSDPRSNGPVEGQLNRLSIELLRARPLPEPASSGS